MAIAAGASQSGTVGEPLDTALTVFITDKFGDPVPGVLVRFVVGPAAGKLEPVTTTTGPGGDARAIWTLPKTVGSYLAVASASGLDSVTFAATAGPAGPATLTLLGRDSVAGTAGAALDSAVVVELRDGFGNPVPDAALTVVVTGGGSAAGTVTTDPSGRGHIPWTLGLAPAVNTLAVTEGTLPPVRVAAIGFPPLPLSRLSLAQSHGCWVNPAGAAVCWGRNDRGQLGDGGATFDSPPVPVAGGLQFSTIATGSEGLFSNASGIAHTCAVATAGETYCWGTADFVTAAVPAPLDGAPALVSLSAGARSACGLTARGQAWCWGGNGDGQLGDGGTTTRSAPAPVTTTLRFRQLAVGATHACGLTRLGAVFCWGDNLNGQLGIDALPDQKAPVRPAGLPVLGSITAGSVHTCGLALDGAAWCWGGNPFGARGEAGSLPVGPRAVPTSLRFSHLMAGHNHTCGVELGGGTYCWGRNYEFALADSAFGWRAAPGEVPGGLAFVELDGGALSTCGRTAADEVYCWGTNASFLAGRADTTVQTARIVHGGLTFSRAATGWAHACGLTAAGAAYCWGFDQGQGALGDGGTLTTPRPLPFPVAGGLSFTGLDASAGTTCGLSQTGEAWCWGRNEGGEVGDGSTENRAIPTQVAGGHSFTSISVGVDMACALTAAGEPWCWGRGDWQAIPIPTPVAISVAEPLVQIAVGWRQACGVAASGSAYCWLPPTSVGQSPIATPAAPGLQLVAITAGAYQACGLTAEGKGWCWGLNNYGQLGDGTTTEQLVPVPVSGGLTFSSLTTAADGWTTCGVTTVGTPHCWGRNEFGTAGSGGVTDEPVPTPVFGAPAMISIDPSAHATCGLATSGDAVCWGWSGTGVLGTGSSQYILEPVRVQ